MGGNTSRQNAEMEREVRERHERELREAEARRAEEERLAREAIRVAENAKILEEQLKRDKEIEEEAQRNLDQVLKAAESSQSMKKTLEKKLNELEIELQEKHEKLIELMKKSGAATVEEEKKMLEKEKDDLKAEKTFLVYELEKLDKSKEEQLKERGKATKVLDEEETRRNKAHHEQMRKLHTDRLDEEVKTEKALIEIAHDFKQCQIETGKEKSIQQAIQMENNYQLMDVYTREQMHEDFRRSCTGVINDFNKFKRLFDSEEKDLLMTRDDITYGDVLSSAPNLDPVNRELQDLSEKLLHFSTDGSGDPKKFTALRDGVSADVGSLKTLINDIQSRIGNYQRKKSDETGNTNKERFGISEIYKDVKDLIRELSEKISEFKVPASDEFDRVLAGQFEQLSFRQEQIINRAIGPSTERARVQIEEAPIDPAEEEGTVEDAED